MKLAAAVLLLCAWPLLRAQTAAGLLLGVVSDGAGLPAGGARVTAEGTPAAFRAETAARDSGEFALALPYGEYRIAAQGASLAVTVSPLHPVCVRLSPAGGAETACPGNARPWSARPEGPARGMSQLLLEREPAAVSEPLDFSWPVFTAFPLLSERGSSWTATRETWQGVDVTDPYQPGRSDAALDATAVEEAGVRTGFDLGSSTAYGSEIAAFVMAPGAAWHAAAATSDSGNGLASGNLPAARGPLQQTAKYQRYSDDSLQAGGPIGRRADALVSLAGLWSSQTVPLAAPGGDLQRGLLSGAALVRAQITSRDQAELDFAGSRAHQPNWCMPAGVESWAGRPMAPAFTYPSIEGFGGCAETDTFGSFQAVWTRATASGLWQARGGAWWAHPDTSATTPGGVSSITDMATGATNGVAPVSNLATRMRQFAAGDYARPYVQTGRARHALSFGAEWDRAAARNRYNTPGGVNLVTANGAPAYAVLFYDTQPDFTERVMNFTAHARDAIALLPWLTADVGAVANVARGGGVLWKTVSPRVGLALTPGRFRRVSVRAGYARLYEPLAARYLDFGGFNGVGGAEYQWVANGGQPFTLPYGQLGALVTRFGAPFSNIDPGLRPPHAGEFHLAAEVALAANTTARAWFFCREERNRIADVDTGVPASAYLPVAIDDPGTDGVAGTFDDQTLTVYARQPSSFGQDRYLLTNPAGLDASAQGFVLEAGTRWRGYAAHASLMAVETSGPVNPGNSPLENDPGAIGALDSDPNAGIQAGGRQFFDRAYVGKAQFLGRLPRVLGGVAWENTVNYMDGASFARELLVTGLPQGPILVDATAHGSPGGGSRAEHVMNWNLRLSRAFAAPRGQVRVGLDLINVMNSNHKILESAVSGPAFDERLALAIEPARCARVFLRYAF